MLRAFQLLILYSVKIAIKHEGRIKVFSNMQRLTEKKILCMLYYRSFGEYVLVKQRLNQEIKMFEIQDAR